MSLLAGLLPGTVEVEELTGPATDGGLFPEEEVAVARAVAKRRHEFASVRRCARTALGRLGVAPAAILPGERGAPGWPPGVVGSMTHCAGYCAAAVARQADLLGVGIDAEPDEPLPAGVLSTVALPAEAGVVARLLAERPGPCWDRLLFSAKESVYKVWFPLAGRWLGFDEARVDVDPDGTFTARLLVPAPPVGGAPLTVLHGRWAASGGVVVSAIALGRDS